MFNPCKKIVVYCNVSAYFVGLWRHENHQGPIFSGGSTLFVVTFDNITTLWL